MQNQAVRFERGLTLHDALALLEDDESLAKMADEIVIFPPENVCGVLPVHTVQRYSRKEKKIVQIEQPHLINLYNANMGGVDRSDQNISLYRSSVRGKKWYCPLLVHAMWDYTPSALLHFTLKCKFFLSYPMYPVSYI
ncbi:hypothetical protein M5D96_013575 [Drosophila gunungcola]|uniref:PiggyBac transposable element-derived protein domain-containing protein n=1 Tax=Drosophila gunungcola TaxID=103775 RepID=A0A9P9YB37_9MUSC|nr:hypothetical protein M5D96_013575 [Drosophila gunungcola]